MERKHRTSVFVLEVSEELDEWEDSKCIPLFNCLFFNSLNFIAFSYRP